MRSRHLRVGVLCLSMAAWASAAEAQLRLAQATFQRMSGLYDKKSISDQEFDEARARLSVAEAGHKMALSKREQLAAGIAQASAAGVPASGVITVRAFLSSVSSSSVISIPSPPKCPAVSC